MTDEAKIERLEEALWRISVWANAYPLEVFPEPNLDQARTVLKEAGISVDAITASAMRHVITQVANIAREALRDHHNAD